MRGELLGQASAAEAPPLSPGLSPCCSVLLRVRCCNHRGDMGRKKMTPFAKAKKLQKRMEASLPSALQEELGTTTVTDSSPPEIVETQHSSAAHSVNSITTRQRNWSSHVFIHGKTYVTSQPAPSQPAWSSQRTPQPQSQQTPAQHPQSPWAPTPGANANLKTTQDFEKISKDLEHALHCLQQISNYAREAHSSLSYPVTD